MAAGAGAGAAGAGAGAAGAGAGAGAGAFGCALAVPTIIKAAIAARENVFMMFLLSLIEAGALLRNRASFADRGYFLQVIS